MNNTEDSFNKNGLQISVDTRKVHAVRAYFEWMPIRYFFPFFSFFEHGFEVLTL